MERAHFDVRVRRERTLDELPEGARLGDAVWRGVIEVGVGMKLPFPEASYSNSLNSVGRV